MGFFDNLFATVERPVRLLEAQRPLRRKVRISGDLRVLLEQSARSRSDTQIDILPPGDIAGLEDARIAG